MDLRGGLVIMKINFCKSCEKIKEYPNVIKKIEEVCLVHLDYPNDSVVNLSNIYLAQNRIVLYLTVEDKHLELTFFREHYKKEFNLVRYFWEKQY